MESIELTIPQAKFVQAKERICGYFGGWGNGKSLAGILKAYLYMRNYPKSNGIIGRKRMTDLKGSGWEQFFEIVPEQDIKAKVVDEGMCEFHNGSKVWFKYFERMEGKRSTNYNWAWIDQIEECKEEAFLEILGRLRRPQYGPRQLWVTGNPAGNWCKAKFKTDPAFSINHLAWTLKDGTKCTAWERRRSGVYVIDAPTETNKEHLPADYIQSLLTDFPKRWVDRYYYGGWDSFEGQVYPDLKESVHFIQPFEIPSDWPRTLGLDYGGGGNHPTACVWCASDWDGNLYLYQEYEEFRTPVSQHVQNIKNLSGGKMGPVFLDATTWGKYLQKDGRPSWSVADEFAEKGLPCIRANNDVLAGINRVSEYLLVDEQHTHPISHTTGSPYLFIFSNLFKLWKSMSEYVWKEDLLKEETQKETPLKVNEHLADCVRYIILSKPPVYRRPTYKPDNTWEAWLKRAFKKEEKGKIGWEEQLETR